MVDPSRTVLTPEREHCTDGVDGAIGGAIEISKRDSTFTWSEGVSDRSIEL
jgi:hypothetical protein